MSTGKGTTTLYPTTTRESTNRSLESVVVLVSPKGTVGAKAVESGGGHKRSRTTARTWGRHVEGVSIATETPLARSGRATSRSPWGRGPVTAFPVLTVAGPTTVVTPVRLQVERDGVSRGPLTDRRGEDLEEGKGQAEHKGSPNFGVSRSGVRSE